MKRFCGLEEVPSAKLLTREEQYCETHFKIHTKRDRSGRFIVRLPIRLDSPQLCLSYKIALKRFSQIEWRLCSNPQLRAEYVSIMEEYQKSGHMRLVSNNPKDNDGFYYMPHHPVFKEQSTTTEVRVVFDASCKSDNGISLNDILAVGPKVQQDLLALIRRFRTHQVALTADVAKMYRQIRVDDEDINLQRILWRESPLELVSAYQLTTVTHGISPASFLATRCLIQLAEEAHEFPRTSQILKRDFCLDDALYGTDTVEEAIELRQELQTLLARGGFSLRKWSSNHTAVLETIPAEFRETRCSLRLNEKDSIKTLGLSWNPTTDEFLFEIHVKECTGPPTKRKVFSIISPIFDPLGLLGPVVVLLKMFMQQMWQANLGWDDTLPFPMLQTWQALYKDLPELNNVRTHRLIFGRRKMSEIQIHGISDASEKAYTACVYARCITEDGECSVRLVCSKSRVAPLKQQSIPRLELCGALLLACLFAKTMQTLELKIDSIFLWADSTIVLAWIRAEPTKWKTFVANHVVEIQELTVGASWNHVLSEGNPADKLSRGESAGSLRNDKQWWQGPSWLKQEQAYWPSVIPICAMDEFPEQRTKMQCFANTIHQEDIINRFSSLHRLQRVIAYCNRFVSNARRKSKMITGSLSSEELATALDICIRKAQHLTYASEISALKISSDASPKSLNPFLDGNGILRVGGRLHNCLKPFAEQHQIILPPRHHLTELIITSKHVRLLHAGCQHLIGSLRRKYWIVNIRRIARPIIHKCMPCFRLKATTATQLMGQLPTPRVTPSRPFFNTGVDYAGPLYIKQSGTRSKIKLKCYVALFICLSTKVVHLELVHDLTSQAFIAALQRFTAGRGKCASIYSDNATNFVGAKNELEELRNMLKSKDTRAEIEDHAANEGFRWYFMPPNAPHFGGLWEASVKSMKHHLRRTAGNASLTYDERHTLLCQIKACLNSQLLIRISDDPDDFAYLSPGHFLIGAPLTAIPEPDWSVDAHSHASRWRFIQSLQQGFWKQWSSDYLNSLQQRSKWRDSHPNLTPGMVVIVREDNLPPLSWKLAVIKEVIPGKDVRVWTAVIRTSSGNLKHSIHKLCPLPSQ